MVSAPRSTSVSYTHLFDIIEPAFRSSGYNLVVLENDNRDAINTGLRFVNNDACYPSLLVVGQIMDAVLSGKYDMTKTAVLKSQTGGAVSYTHLDVYKRQVHGTLSRCVL